MKKLAPAALLCALFLLFSVASAEGVWTDNAHRWHATQACALARGRSLMPAADSYPTFAADDGVYPCPACGEDWTDAPGVQAWTRGGTVIVRIPDAWLAARLAEESVPAVMPEALLYGDGTRDEDLARLLHGQAYAACLAPAPPGTARAAAVCVPECAGDGDLLEMSRRHMGGAWVLAVRPDKAGRKALSKSGGIALPLRLWRAALEIKTYPAGVVFEARDAALREMTLTLEPEKSSGEVVWREDDAGDGISKYIVRDGTVNTLILRDGEPPRGEGLTRRACFLGQRFTLRGYADEDDAVYICAVDDAEAACLRDKWFFDLDLAPLWRTEDGEAADPAQSEADYLPVARAALPDGTVAALTAAAYPVGTPFVACTLTRPGGGVAPFTNEARLERLSGGQWVPADANLRGRVNGEADRAHGGWFCDRVVLAWPLEGLGALGEGLYRVQVRETWMEAEDAYARTWLEFRIRDGAPEPALPEAPVPEAPDFELPDHAPPHADAEHYNSCADTTRLHVSGTRSDLLAGGVVYALRGIDESWGWGIGSHYSLFAWPEGQPERAVMLIEDLDPSDMTLYDLGNGLLLRDNANRFFRCDLDGGYLQALGTAFREWFPLVPGGGMPSVAEGDPLLLDVLPVGEGLYLATETGIWYATPETVEQPVRVYRAADRIQNSDGGNGRMVYADQKLFVADGGIVALDTTRRDAEGLMPATRLTEDYDPTDGANGFGYIVLNGRLYCRDNKKKATVSMDLEGGDLRVVSNERFWFHTVTPSGVVLALTGSQEGLFGDERSAAAFYFPPDPEDPAFDPDNCEKRAIAAGDFDYILGDWLCHTGADGRETRERIAPAPDEPENRVPAVTFPPPEALAGR